MIYSIVIRKVVEWSFLAMLSKKVTECVGCKACLKRAEAQWEKRKRRQKQMTGLPDRHQGGQQSRVRPGLACRYEPGSLSYGHSHKKRLELVIR